MAAVSPSSSYVVIPNGSYLFTLSLSLLFPLAFSLDPPILLSSFYISLSLSHPLYSAFHFYMYSLPLFSTLFVSPSPRCILLHPTLIAFSFSFSLLFFFLSVSQLHQPRHQHFLESHRNTANNNRLHDSRQHQAAHDSLDVLLFSIFFFFILVSSYFFFSSTILFAQQYLSKARRSTADW